MPETRRSQNPPPETTGLLSPDVLTPFDPVATCLLWLNRQEINNSTVPTTPDLNKVLSSLHQLSNPPTSAELESAINMALAYRRGHPHKPNCEQVDAAIVTALYRLPQLQNPAQFFAAAYGYLLATEKPFDPTPPLVHFFSDPRTTLKKTTAIRSEMEQLLEKLHRQNNNAGLVAFCHWCQRLNAQAQQADPLAPPINYIPKLIRLLDPDQNDKFARTLVKKLRQPTRVEVDNLLTPRLLENTGLTPAAAQVLLHIYESLGLLKLSPKAGYCLTPQGESGRLTYTSLQSILLTQQLEAELSEPPPISSLSQAAQAAETHHDRTRAKTIAISLPGIIMPQILHIAEARIGNQDTDLALLNNMISRLESLPPDQLPHIICVSGLLEGNYPFRDKDRRAALIPGLDSLNTQFRLANEVLQRLAKLKVPVVYVLSDHDLEICRNGTIYVLKNLANSNSSKVPEFTSPHRIDQMRANRRWDIILNFQVDVVFPYCLRSGRRLYSQAEMAAKYGVAIDEFLLLWETAKALQNHQPIPAYCHPINLNLIPRPDQKFPYEIADDAKLVINHGLGRQEIILKHNFAFSSKPLYGTPHEPIARFLGQQQAQNHPTPDQVVIYHQQLGLDFNIGNTTVTLLPSMIDNSNYLNTRASKSAIPGNDSHRQSTTRRIIAQPSLFQTSIHVDGHRKEITIHNPYLTAKASGSDRTAVVYINDLQIGSPTARIDLQIKYLDFLFSRIIPDYPTAIIYLGDQGQFLNFKGSFLETRLTRLVSADEHTGMLLAYTWPFLQHTSNSDLENLRWVAILPGNHEWNTAWRETGAIFTGPLTDLYRRRLSSLDNPPQIFRPEKMAIGPDLVNTWTHFGQLAGYGLMSHHIISHRKPTKGGSLPIYAAISHSQDLGPIIKKVDIHASAHYHRQQCLLMGNKLYLIPPAMAGTSGYELGLNYNPEVGANILWIGGDQPPTLQHLTEKFFWDYQPQHPTFSPRGLARAGFKDDRHFDPSQHGLYLPGPKSALQKFILQELTPQVIYGDMTRLV